ncbi:MAG: hypothetical protein U9N47_06870 [Thermodesulfobacteriota bacterium]|nr:hypothetical protein [Thermodesulfobacteriota bacterium]
MIDKDSPLRKLPHGLSAKQIVFFDALRVSAEIAGQAYDDLVSGLHLLGEGAKRDQPPNFVGIIRHAWTFVDAAHRFRVVLQQTPSIKHNHVYKLFMRRTNTVTKMRDNAQHLNQNLDGIAERSQGAYGTLTWVLGVGEDSVPKPMMLNIGTAYGRVVGPEIDFQEQLPIGEIHRVRLELADRFLMLSDVYEHLASMVRSLVAPLADFAEGKPRYGSDQFINFNLTPVDETLGAGTDI